MLNGSTEALMQISDPPIWLQDVLVLMQAPVVPMSFLRAKPIGVMQMIDQGEQDDKVIAVHADDPEFRDYDDINQLPKHRLAEIRRYGQGICQYALLLPALYS